MKGVKSILCAAIAGIHLASCDTMTDNGRLDGMWQLMSVSYNVQGGQDSVVNVKNSRVYMHFQSDLAQITPGALRTDSMGRHILMRFDKKGGNLRLHDFYAFFETAGPIGTERSAEEILLADSATTMLRPFGIDGLYANFAIRKLNGKAMVLQSDFAKLTLRKF